MDSILFIYQRPLLQSSSTLSAETTYRLNDNLALRLRANRYMNSTAGQTIHHSKHGLPQPTAYFRSTEIWETAMILTPSTTRLARPLRDNGRWYPEAEIRRRSLSNPRRRHDPPDLPLPRVAFALRHEALW